jgi:hypothetical protein
MGALLIGRKAATHGRENGLQSAVTHQHTMDTAAMLGAVAGPDDQEAFESFQQIGKEQW